MQCRKYLLSLLSIVMVPALARAADFHFTGAVSTDWSNPANWAEDAVPTSLDNVFIPVDKTAALPSDTAIGNLSIASYGAIDINGYQLTVHGQLQNVGGSIEGGGILLFTTPEIGLENYGFMVSDPTLTLRSLGGGSLDIAGTNGTNTGKPRKGT